MKLVALFLVLCVVSGLMEAETDSVGMLGADGVPMEGESRPPTVRYLLREKSFTKEALRKLHLSHPFQIKAGAERKDELVETFGHAHHAPKLASLGFELLQTEEGWGGFSNPGYHNPKQLHEAFKKLESEFPKQAKIFDLTKEYNMDKTTEGRSIYALKVSDNVEKDESEPNVLIVSNHHARELITPELILDQATRLLKGYATAERMERGDLGDANMEDEEMKEAADAKKIVDKNQLYMMWTMNPDGLNTVWTKDNWKRTNARNVDLNRNYPIGWDLSCGGSTDRSGETFRGDKPFSETETKTMRKLQENRNFAKVMDFHSYAEQVRTNYGNCAHLPKKIDQKFEQIRNKVANKMDYQASRSCCMGGNIHYAYNRHGSLAYLVETGRAFQPSAREKDATVKQVWPGVKKFLQQPISVSGIVTDKATGKPIPGASIKLSEYKFSQKEQHRSGERGHYHLWIPNGKHQVEVHAKGKPVKKMEIEAKEGGNVQNIQL